MTIPAGYYAIPDPENPDLMTYWRVIVAPDGSVASWTASPPRARYGPQMLKRNIPADRAERLAVMRQFSDRLTDWTTRVRDAITADTAGCAARYAEFTTKCFCCGRELRSARWKVLGIGPDCCRKYGLNATVLASLTTPAIAAAHSVHAAQKAGIAA
jgi:hypothetical protein